MDCWYEVKKQYGTIGTFFAHYLTQSSYESGKVATYKTVNEYHSNQNFFHACIKLYQVNNNFSYSDFLFLYGIITYLINKEKIEESAFVERLRILRNLIWNSNSGEIRSDADYMSDLLAEVSQLMLEGSINKSLKHGFNGFQEDEEIEKMQRRSGMKSQEIETMYKFEDHPLIYGYVSGLGYDHLYLTDTFYSVFTSENYKSLHRAMISIGDYRQHDDNRYYMANTNRSTWTQLLHKSRNRANFENSMTIVVQMLDRVKGGESLDDIRENFLGEQQQQQLFTWRYYFAKYPNMLRGADGELTWGDTNYYICTALNKHQFNGQHWNPFLNVLYQMLNKELREKYNEQILSLDNYGGNLIMLHPVSSIASTGDGYDYFVQDSSTHWSVNQNSDGVDMEDRIEVAIKNINDIVESYYNSIDYGNKQD